MLRLAAVIGLVALTACAPPPPNACQTARSYGQKFGTPEDRGPCWGRTISSAQMGDIRTYMVQMPMPSYTVGTMTYQGTRLIQAGITTGP